VARQGEARRLAGVWLTGRKGVDADMLSPVLSTAAWSGGKDFFDSLLHALKATADSQRRQIIIGGLGSFYDPKMVRQSFALWLDPDLEFLEAIYDAVVKRSPSAAGLDFRAFLPFPGRSACDEPSPAGIRRVLSGPRQRLRLRPAELCQCAGIRSPVRGPSGRAGRRCGAAFLQTIGARAKPRTLPHGRGSDAVWNARY
jgi:hypothetical protein